MHGSQVTGGIRPCPFTSTGPAPPRAASRETSGVASRDAPRLARLLLGNARTPLPAARAAARPWGCVHPCRFCWRSWPAAGPPCVLRSGPPRRCPPRVRTLRIRKQPRRRFDLLPRRPGPRAPPGPPGPLPAPGPHQSRTVGSRWPCTGVIPARGLRGGDRRVRTSV